MGESSMRFSITDHRNSAIVLALTAVLMVAWPNGLLAQKANLFTIANFGIRAEASNAVEAKQKAMAEGTISAFRVLAKRLTNYSNYLRLPDLDNNAIDPLLQGISVRREQNSRTAYIATYDFKFKAAAVRKFFRAAAVPISEIQAPPTTVLPIFLKNGQISVNGQRTWRQQWLKLDLQNSATPVRLARTSSDITAENVLNLKSGDADLWQQMAGKFGNSQFVIVIADERTEQNDVQVNIIGQDATGTVEHLRDYKGSALDTLRRAAVTSFGILEGRWKFWKINSSVESLQTSAIEPVSLLVQFSSLKEWQQTRKKLQDIPNLDALEVESLSARGAVVKFAFPGGINTFGRLAEQYQLSVNNDGGVWTLRSY
ncbi:MAG: DUF2066 domain-containing protein [Methyloligellaceae bacterium]